MPLVEKLKERRNADTKTMISRRKKVLKKKRTTEAPVLDGS